ncbi:acylphosphatase [Oenococcus alcoholitolerans]|uniref:acylphosphatase n=1 Tax=Oenococcus alcoholitolerans TaxID=931074 RepID=UPI003F709176
MFNFFNRRKSEKGPLEKEFEHPKKIDNSSSEKERHQYIFSGQVQGVGFRITLKTLAERRGLTGWVKNLSNGDVQAEIQGPKEDLDYIIYLMKSGNGFIRITDLKDKKIKLIFDEKNFKII